jgi:hypothetical protein
LRALPMRGERTAAAHLRHPGKRGHGRPRSQRDRAPARGGAPRAEGGPRRQAECSARPKRGIATAVRDGVEQAGTARRGMASRTSPGHAALSCRVAGRLARAPRARGRSAKRSGA